MSIEKRVQPTLVEVRSNEEDNSLTVTGYAIRYNEESEVLSPGFKEIIKPYAFSESIKKRNIVALYQHDPKELLASTKANSLRLEERDDGIYFELDLLESRKGIYELIQRGDLANMSFGFSVKEENFTRNKEEGYDIREVTKGELYEVSLVHSPAYPTTSVSQRSIDKYNEFKGEDEMTKEQQQEIGIDMTQRHTAEKAEEVRMIGRNETFAEEESSVTLAGLIRAYVTGEGTQEERDMLTTTTNGGNFLVPHKIMSNLIDLARNKSFLLNAATKIDMAGHKTVSVPKVLTDPTVSFKLEGEEIEQSKATFGEINLEAKYMYGLVEVPLELLKTGIGVEQKLNDLLATALVQTLEKAALYGMEKGFKGILNDEEIVKDSITLDYEGIKKGVKVIAGNNHEAKDLVLSTNNDLDIGTQKATDGQFITPPPFYNNLNKHVTNFMDDQTVLLGDLTSVYVGLLQNASMSVSQDFGFSKGTIAIRIMWYGDVILAEPTKLALLTVEAGE